MANEYQRPAGRHGGGCAREHLGATKGRQVQVDQQHQVGLGQLLVLDVGDAEVDHGSRLVGQSLRRGDGDGGEVQRRVWPTEPRGVAGRTMVR